MTMKKALKRLLRAFLITFKLQRRAAFELRWSKEHPKAATVKTGDLIIVGVEGEYQKWAYFKCPCGCGNQLRLSLSAKDNPCWRVDVTEEGVASIHPSVRQINGCFSHFWLKEGEIDWCHDTGMAIRTW